MFQLSFIQLQLEMGSLLNTKCLHVFWLFLNFLLCSIPDLVFTPYYWVSVIWINNIMRSFSPTWTFFFTFFSIIPLFVATLTYFFLWPLFFKKNIYLIGCAGTWLPHRGFLIFIAAHEILSCSMWDAVPWPGIKPKS